MKFPGSGQAPVSSQLGQTAHLLLVACNYLISLNDTDRYACEIVSVLNLSKNILPIILFVDVNIFNEVVSFSYTFYSKVQELFKALTLLRALFQLNLNKAAL